MLLRHSWTEKTFCCVSSRKINIKYLLQLCTCCKQNHFCYFFCRTPFASFLFVTVGRISWQNFLVGGGFFRSHPLRQLTYLVQKKKTKNETGFFSCSSFRFFCCCCCEDFFLLLLMLIVVATVACVAAAVSASATVDVFPTTTLQSLQILLLLLLQLLLRISCSLTIFLKHFCTVLICSDCKQLQQQQEHQQQQR